MTGHYVTLEETLEKLRAVTVDEVKALAARLAAQPRSAVILAPEAFIGQAGDLTEPGYVTEPDYVTGASGAATR